MFRPEKMQKVRVVSLNSVVKRVVSELHEMGVMEISRLPKSELKTGVTFSDYDMLSKRLVQLRAIENILSKYEIKGHYTVSLQDIKKASSKQS